MNTTHNIKSCSCRACRAGRGKTRKTINRKARRFWNELTRRIAESEIAGVASGIALVDFQGDFTD